MLKSVSQKAICICLLGGILWGGLPTLVRGDGWSRNGAQLLYQWLSPQLTAPPAGCSETQTEMRQALIRFYEQRRYQLAWVDDYGLLPEGDVVLAVVGDQGRVDGVVRRAVVADEDRERPSIKLGLPQEVQPGAGGEEGDRHARHPARR